MTGLLKAQLGPQVTVRGIRLRIGVLFVPQERTTNIETEMIDP